MKKRSLEIVFGIIIIMVPILFTLYAAYIIKVSGGKTYSINAVFNNVSSLYEGNKVVFKGLEIGKVRKITLNEEMYNIIVNLDIREDIKIPKDSTFAIISSSFMGASKIEVIFGESKEFLAKEETSYLTKDSVLLEERIGNIFFNINK